jgi:hypothetical protein
LKNRSAQLLILGFLFILIVFGSHWNTLSLSLSEKQASGVSYIDPYPNWFIDSFSRWYLDGEKALGPPDNEVATIYQDYGNGYITLDFGRNQEIINGTGPDFTVYANGGSYIIRIGNDISSFFEILENDTGGVTFHGNYSFDLTGTNYATIRYIQVEASSLVNVQLDAVEALNYYEPIPETIPPEIIDFSPEDLWVWSNQSSVQISWEVNEPHPWNYSILVDGELVVQGLWMDDSIIKYQLEISDKSESVEIIIILDDLFGNSKEETYEVEIRTPKPSGGPTVFPLFPLFLGVICVSTGKIWRRKVKK